MMEASSPLAALQPSAFIGHSSFHKDAPPSYATYAAVKTFGPNSFNFRDLSMKRPSTDYFSMGPMRGSSPTASLAADLSQNFHIDQSPQLPTPRRALFSRNISGANYGRVSVTTPPVISSSPGLPSDSMDMSPLPHKAPFGSSFDMHPQSPTPELTSADSSLLSIPSPPLSDPVLEQPAFGIQSNAPKLRLPLERRKTNPLRPSLSRAKGFSTTSIPHHHSAEAQLPPFKFGNGISRPATSSSLSLSEIFIESPIQEKPVPRVNAVMGPPRPRPTLGLSANIRNGSPVGGHVRKSSNPMVRPRKQFRRSLSMFEHPEDIMQSDKPSSTLPSITDVEPVHVPQLPHFLSQDQPGELPRITAQTLIDVLDGQHNSKYEKLVIIDCRFEYEYNGGHIDGAVNFNDKDKLAAQLFDLEPTPKALLIFHCEYSAHRAPIMAKHIRNKDRTVNAERYPQLSYPETYILDGGYSSFFKDYRVRCFPQNYVEMDDKEHSLACERGLGKVKQRSKLVRAQTYAFGQHSPSMDSSPTAMGRSRVGGDIDMDLGMGTTFLYSTTSLPPFDPRSAHTRRMFSY